MKTAMQELRDMIERMTQNGGDYDLLCVLGLIDDKFLETEKQQIIEAVTYGQVNNSVSYSGDLKIAKNYFQENFGNTTNKETLK